MSLSFSGATDRVDCGSAANIDEINVVTYCAWIYPTSVTVTRTFGQKNGGSGKRFRLNGAVRSGGIQFAVSMSVTNGDAQAAANTIVVNTWQFVAGTYSAGLVPRIFRGVPGGAVAEVSYAVQTTGSGSVSPDAAANFLIGGDASNSFPGRIAEFMLVGRALTAGELTAVMYGTIPADLKGYWPLFGKGSPEPDYSGQKNNGTVTGATQAAHPPIRPRFAMTSEWMGAYTASAGGVTGSVAVTNANDTSAASGTTTIKGSSTASNAADTSSASGNTQILGSASASNANDTSSASGNIEIQGSSATTNANDTSSASGTTTVKGASATTNANDTASAAGSVPANGTSNTTNASDTASASGTTTIVGTAAVSNANDTANGQGVAGLIQGGGGGKKKRRESKSWDQRARERQAELEANRATIEAREAFERRQKYGDIPASLEAELAREPVMHRANQTPLRAHDMREYERIRAPLHSDDEEAFALILELI